VLERRPFYGALRFRDHPDAPISEEPKVDVTGAITTFVYEPEGKPLSTQDPNAPSAEPPKPPKKPKARRKRKKPEDGAK
jgi:hypothetical protein